MSVFFKEEQGIGYITFDQPDAKVNVLNSATLVLLDQMLDEVKTKSLKVLVFQSAKKDIFVAGADIKEIEWITEVSDGKKKAQAGQNVLNKIEDLPYPTVAVINGVALGGGCELALACRYRVSTFNDKVRIGLPEVNLGFVPGFGGTYRLPRLVGLQQGLKMIISGAPISSSAAFKAGLVDRLYPQTGLGERVQEFVAEVAGEPKKRIFKRAKLKGMNGFLENTLLGHILIFRQARQTVQKASKGFYPAPMKAVDVISRTTHHLPREKALDIESTAFAELAVTLVSKNLVKLFYLTEKYKKLTYATDEKPRPVTKGAVIGAGIMGGGIAQLLSSRGVWARLKDINQEAIAKGMKAAADVYNQAVKRKKMRSYDAAGKMAMISGTTDYSGFKDADIVIEAVVENMDIKKKVFAEVSHVVADHTILASNTSSLSVTEMGQAAKDPTRVIGFHFFNPVHRMPLIEIITTEKTSAWTIVTTLEFAKKLGKTPIIVKDRPGFLVNRILLAYINEAGRILEEGGTIEGIDKAAVEFGMPMGPFTLSDEVGLDVGVKVLHILQAGLGERFKATKVFEQVSEKKLLGKKTGKGFYIHGKVRKVNPEVVSLTKGGTTKKSEAVDRMMLIMINEAAMILDEGVVDSADTVDIGMIMGTGFPPFRGGLLRYADTVGINQIIADMEKYEARDKDGRFKPSAYLLKLKAEGKKFFN